MIHFPLDQIVKVPDQYKNIGIYPKGKDKFKFTIIESSEVLFNSMGILGNVFNFPTIPSQYGHFMTGPQGAMMASPMQFIQMQQEMMNSFTNMQQNIVNSVVEKLKTGFNLSANSSIASPTIDSPKLEMMDTSMTLDMTQANFSSASTEEVKLEPEDLDAAKAAMMLEGIEFMETEVRPDDANEMTYCLNIWNIKATEQIIGVLADYCSQCKYTDYTEIEAEADLFAKPVKIRNLCFDIVAQLAEKVNWTREAKIKTTAQLLKATTLKIALEKLLAHQQISDFSLKNAVFEAAVRRSKTCIHMKGQIFAKKNHILCFEFQELATDTKKHNQEIRGDMATGVEINADEVKS